MSDTKNSQHTGSVARAGKVLAVGALLVIAAAISGHYLLSNDRQAVADSSAKIQVVCKNCNYEFEMPFNEYQKRAPRGAQLAGGLVCPKCGAKAVQRVEQHLPAMQLPAESSSTGQSGQPAPQKRPLVGGVD